MIIYNLLKALKKNLDGREMMCLDGGLRVYQKCGTPNAVSYCCFNCSLPLKR